MTKDIISNICYIRNVDLGLKFTEANTKYEGTVSGIEINTPVIISGTLVCNSSKYLDYFIKDPEVVAPNIEKFIAKVRKSMKFDKFMIFFFGVSLGIIIYSEIKKIIKNKQELSEDLIQEEDDEGDEEDDLCIICYEYKKSIIMLPCGHLCTCERCFDQLRNLSQLRNNYNGFRCPVCKTNIEQHKIIKNN